MRFVFLKMIFTILFVCPTFASESAKKDSELKLALNWKAEPEFGGIYAAKELGFFKESNLNVQILEGGSGTPTMQMLAAGTVDYAIVAADEILMAHDRGAKDVVAIFATYQTNPQGILTHAERGFKSLDDVLKAEGVLQWQNGLPYTQFFLKKYAPVKVKTVPYAGGVAAFMKDPTMSQQGFVTSETIAAEKLGAKVKTFLIAESGYNPYTAVLATKASRLKSNPDEVKKVFQAVKKGWESYLKDPRAINTVMANINKGMDQEMFASSAAAQVGLIETVETKKMGLGYMTSERWSQLAQQMKSLGIIKAEVKASDLFVTLK